MLTIGPQRLAPTVNFFFYGTLLDPEVRAVVLGEGTRPRSIAPAAIIGFRRAPVIGRTYPMLVLDAGARVDGSLVSCVDLNAACRTSFFEGDDYFPELTEIMVGKAGTAHAWVYMPRGSVRAAPGTWSFDAWRQRYLAVYLRDSRIWMRRCGGRELARYRTEWHSRAAGT